MAAAPHSSILRRLLKLSEAPSSTKTPSLTAQLPALPLPGLLAYLSLPGNAAVHFRSTKRAFPAQIAFCFSVFKYLTSVCRCLGFLKSTEVEKGTTQIQLSPFSLRSSLNWFAMNKLPRFTDGFPVRVHFSIYRLINCISVCFCLYGIVIYNLLRFEVFFF